MDRKGIIGTIIWIVIIFLVISAVVFFYMFKEDILSKGDKNLESPETENNGDFNKEGENSNTKFEPIDR